MAGRCSGAHGLFLPMDDRLLFAGCHSGSLVGVRASHGKDPELPDLDERDDLVKPAAQLPFLTDGVCAGGGVGDSLRLERFDTFGTLMVFEVALCFSCVEVFARCFGKGDIGDCFRLSHCLFAIGDARGCLENHPIGTAFVDIERCGDVWLRVGSEREGASNCSVKEGL